MRGTLFILLWLMVVQVSGQQNNGAIEGKITQSDGTPLANAEITISRAEVEEAPTVVKSDSTGYYIVHGMSSGEYVVSARHAGYLPCTYGQKRSQASSTVKVTTGQRTPDIDCKLIAQGVISGRVLGEDNEPRVGAVVQALSPHYVGRKRSLLPSNQATTNDLGEYRIYGLAPGRYYINVSQQELYHTISQSTNSPPEERYTSTFYPSASSVDHAGLINVSPGQELQGIDIAALRGRTFHIRGKVTGLSPATHYVRVSLHPQTPGFEVIYRGRDIAPDTGGNFDLGGILSGLYVLSVSFAKEGQVYRVLREIEVRNEDVNDLYLAPSLGIEVRGRIRLYSSNGEREFSAPSVKINLEAIRAVSEMDALSTQATSGGSFRFQGVNRNTYSVNLEGLSGDLYFKNLRLNNVDIHSKMLDLTHAESITSLDILVGDDGGEVTGIAKNANGQAEEGAIAVLVPDTSHRDDVNLFKEERTDRLGRFTIRGIIPGKYKLFVWNDIESGEYNDPEFLRAYEDMGLSVQVEGSDRKALDVQVISADSSNP